MGLEQQLTKLATETEARLKGLRPTAPITSTLAWAAWNVGAALAAANLAGKINSEEGHADAASLLGIESIDVLEVASVGLAARSAVTTVDLCAATAWRFEPGHPGMKQREADFADIQPHLAQLARPHADWARAVSSSPHWQVALTCRNQLVHRTTRRHLAVIVGVGASRVASYDVDGTMIPVDVLARSLAVNAEEWFKDFCDSL